MRLRSLGLLAALNGMLPQAQAAPTAAVEASPAPQEAFPLPEIVVTADRLVAAPPTLIIREVSEIDLEAFNAHTVGDGLTPVAGVNVQYGGTSGDARAWIRGFRDRDTLVLFDGIPIASGFEGTIDLNEIATEQVASIRVLKSAPSVIYGTNGMGGVIDILPRTGRDAKPFSTTAEIGTDGRRLLRASAGAGDDRLGFLLTASHDSADEYALSDDFDGDLNQPYGERVNSDYERNSVFLSANAQSSLLGQTSFFYNLSDAEKGLAPTAGVDDPDYERLTLSRRQTIGLSNQFEAIPLALKAYYNSYESELTTYTDSSYRVMDDVEAAEDYSYGLKAYSRLHTNDFNTVILHASLQTDVFKGEGVLKDRDRAEISTWTVAIEDQLVVKETLSLAAGAIFNVFDQTQLDESSTAFSPQVAVAWQASDDLTLHASAAQRTRFPKLRELYRRRYGNPDLEEQTSDNYEIGVTWALTHGITVDAALFHSDVNGLIERPNRTAKYQNLPPVAINGIEFSGSGWMTDDLYARLSYTYVSAEETVPGLGDRQLRSRPEHTAQAELRYRLPWRMFATLNGIYVAGLYDLDDNDVYTKLDSYIVANAKLTWDATERLAAYLAVSNLFDEDYQQRLGDPREGRALRLGVDFHL